MKGKETITCRCGIKITDWKCHHRKYCSIRCHRLYDNPMKNKKTAKKISVNLKGRKITWNDKISKSRLDGFNKGTIKPYWNKENGVQLCGSGNPNWKNGISFIEYPQEFQRIRENIIARDNSTCQNPGCFKKFNKQDRFSFISVHHIDYNKMNNNIRNLISLCNVCNSKANKNRKFWQEFYERIICLKKI